MRVTCDTIGEVDEVLPFLRAVTIRYALIDGPKTSAVLRQSMDAREIERLGRFVAIEFLNGSAVEIALSTLKKPTERKNP